LGAFRAGVSGLTKNIDVAAEDPKFGEEIEDAWNTEVAPALDEIEATIKDNSSMSDLLKKMITDPTGAATAGAGALGRNGTTLAMMVPVGTLPPRDGP